MNLQSLGYVGFQGQSVDKWSDFATRLLGMQVLETSRSCLSLRMDDRKQRLIVDRDGPTGGKIFGWEVADGRALDALVGPLEQRGLAVAREGAEGPRGSSFCAGADYIRRPGRQQAGGFSRPNAGRASICSGPEISGFRTGPLGMGVTIFTVARIEEVMPFYVDVLGFGSAISRCVRSRPISFTSMRGTIALLSSRLAVMACIT